MKQHFSRLEVLLLLEDFKDAVLADAENVIISIDDSISELRSGINPEEWIEEQERLANI